jgi:type IV secretory pathway TrbD component
MKTFYLQVGLGLALGAGTAAAFALIFGSRGLWLALGLAIGLVIGVSTARAWAKNQPQQQK